MSINPKQKELVRELSQKIEQRFPGVKVLGYEEMPGGSLSIRLATPDDSAWDVALEMNKDAVEILIKYGYSITVSPIEDLSTSSDFGSGLTPIK